MIATKETATDHWQMVYQQFACMTDGMGMPIDAEILDAVVALNALGMTTHQSCAGHLDRARPAPWIRILVPEAQQLIRQAIAADTAEDYDQSGQFRSQALAHVAQIHEQLLGWLSQFYADGYPPHDQLLICYPDLPGTLKLTNQGALSLGRQSLSVRKRKLTIYRKTLERFAAFLKQSFVSQSS